MTTVLCTSQNRSSCPDLARRHLVQDGPGISWELVTALFLLSAQLLVNSCRQSSLTSGGRT
jgi:hypothetical protein